MADVTAMAAPNQETGCCSHPGAGGNEGMVHHGQWTLLLVSLLAAACQQTEYGVNEETPTTEDVAPILTVDPPELGFGQVMHDQRASETLTLGNSGNATLEISGISIQRGECFSFSSLSLPLTIAPGQTTTLEVTYLPASEYDEGVLEISSNYLGGSLTDVELTGLGMFPILEVHPNPYNYGYVPISCTFDGILDLDNVGQAPLIISEMLHQGVGFQLVDTPDLPLTIQPGQQEQLTVAFSPPEVGDYSGMLWMTTNGISQQVTATQTATGAEYQEYMDEFWQPDGPWEKVDILFYVDQSGSMRNDQKNLASNFDQFTYFLEDYLDDYQIMVVTNDDGCHNEVIITADYDYADLIFSQAVSEGGGQYTEAGLLLTHKAVGLVDEGECNEGFAREDAKLMIVLLSDEPDQSPASWDTYVESIMDTYPQATMSAIAGDVPGGCATAVPGTGYYEAANATGGAFFSICDSNWGTNIRTLAQLSAGSPTDTFQLTYEPVEDSVQVQVDGESAWDWTFDTEQNAVVFDSDAVPDSGSHIEITYDLYCSST